MLSRNRCQTALQLALALTLAGATAPAWEEVECAHCERAMAAFLQQELFAAPFDPATGARVDHRAPERRIDIEHIRLEMEFPALSERRVRIRETIVFRSMRDDLAAFELDGQGMRLDSVRWLEGEIRLGDVLETPVLESGVENLKPGSPARHFRDRDRLSVAPDRPLARGEQRALLLEFEVENPQEGLNWIVPAAADADARAEVWSQGQPDSNRAWFFCADFPNDFHTTEQIVTVPLPNTAIANGTLTGRVENPNGTATYRYLMTYPHVSYLTSLIVGQFARESEVVAGTTLEYIVPPARGADAMRSFRETGPMLELFNRLFQEPYPFGVYRQTVVRNFSAGGMENITATTLVDQSLLDEATDRVANACGDNSQSLIAHELAHQWFGDMVTCRNWTHLWLNEGWASYCEALWLENACSRSDYEYNLWRRGVRIAAADSVEDPAALVWRELPQPGAAFGYKGSAVYNKGAYVLHMLRERVGTDRFFTGTAAYLDAHKYQPVVTDDFRKSIEVAANDDLELWFRQWVESPGTPKMTVALGYDMEHAEAVVTVRQTQPISAETPAFLGHFDVYLRDAAGAEVRRRLDLTEREHRFSIALAQPPAVFAADPNGAFLKGLTLEVPHEVLVRTASEGPTAFSRLDAISALGRSDRRTAVEVLSSIANDGARFWGERAEALLALGAIQSPASAKALLAVPTGEVADHRVRRALAEALGRFDAETAREALIALSRDPADVVAREALEALGRMQGEGVFEALVAGFERVGNNDRVRRSAVVGMGRLGDPRGITYVIRAAGPENIRRTRTEAINAVGALILGAKEPTEGHALLMELLRDEDAGIARSAVRQLGEARWLPARTEIEKLTLNRRDDRLAEAAREALKRIDDGQPAAIALELRGKVQEQERALQEASRRIEDLEGARREDALRPGAGGGTSEKRRRFLGLF